MISQKPATVPGIANPGLGQWGAPSITPVSILFLPGELGAHMAGSMWLDAHPESMGPNENWKSARMIGGVIAQAAFGAAVGWVLGHKRFGAVASAGVGAFLGGAGAAVRLRQTEYVAPSPVIDMT